MVFEDMLKEFIDENHEHYKDLLTKFSKPKTDEQDRIQLAKLKEEMGIVVTQEELKSQTHATVTDPKTGETFVLVDHEYI